MRNRAAILAILLCAALQAHAQLTGQPMQFTFHDPCGGGNAASCGVVMVGQGEFNDKTVPAFITALKGFAIEDKNPVLGQGISRVIISSPGGSLQAGLELGVEIRRLKMNTTATSNFDEYVRSKAGNDYIKRPILNGAVCASACSYAFLGGIRREVETDNTLGVHQFSSRSTDIDLESRTQTGTAKLALYVQRMGVLPGFMNLASFTRPNEITFITKTQAQELQVDNVNIPLASWQIKATAGGVPIMFANQKLSQSHGVGIVLLYQGQNVVVSTQMVFKGDATHATRLNQFPINDYPTIIFNVDGREFKGTPQKKWTSVNLPNVKTFESVSEFPVSLLKALQRAKKVSITDDFPNATRDISLETDLSTNGLNAGAFLLERSK